MDLRDKVLGGLPIDDFRIIDNHDHIGKWHAFYVPGGGGIDQMVASMDAVGIDQVFVTAHASIGPDFAFGNDIVADAIARYPERVFGYVTVNPNYPDMKGELQKRFANKGFRGIKLHPDCHSRAIDYAGYAPAYEWADEHRLPVLIHVWGPGEVAQVAHLSAEYPNCQFIMGHFGGDTDGFIAGIDLVNKRDNVFGDTAISGGPEGNIEWFVREVNPKKIVFGTDLPFLDPRPTIGRIAMADIPYETKVDIFGRNLAGIMGIQY